jgi:hypothetical protein
MQETRLKPGEADDPGVVDVLESVLSRVPPETRHVTPVPTARPGMAGLRLLQILQSAAA